MHTPAILRQILPSKILWISIVCLLGAIDLFRFPKQLKAVHPSTASFALTEPAKQLIHGRDPYLVRLDLGAPVSPGPGWIILIAPLSLAGGVTLLTPICIAVCCYLLQLKSRPSAGIFVCLVLVQPALLSAGFAGHDLFAIPIAFASLCLLAERFSERTEVIAFLGLLAGFFATSRLPIIVLVLIVGLGLYRRRSRAGTVFLAVSVPVACCLQGAFYLWARHDGVFYQPLHLLSRSSQSGHTMQAIAVVSVCIIAVGIVTAMGNKSRSWILAGGLFLIAAFVPQGAGELVNTYGNYKQWEGAFYVSFGLSLLAATLASNENPSVGHLDDGGSLKT